MPYTWSQATDPNEDEMGDLPDGLDLDETGVIHGTPSETGNDCFTLEVQDSQSPVEETLQERFCIEITS